MLQKIFKVILCKFLPELEEQYSLQIGVDKIALEASGLINIYPSVEGETSFVGALMRNYPLLYESVDCKLLQINILASAETEQHPGILSVFVTANFLQRYNYNFDDICYLKPVTCLSLEKVLFSVKTAESFNWFQDKAKLSTIVKQVTGGNILCHEGDNPLPPHNYPSGTDVFKFNELITLDCQPFSQGILTLKSSIILANICDLPDHFNQSKQVESTSTSDKSFAVDLNLLNFTSSILGKRLKNPAITLPQPLTVKIYPSFEIQIIPKLSTDFKRELEMTDKEVDPLNTIFLLSNVRNRLDSKNGDWVKISLLRPTENKFKAAPKLSSREKDPVSVERKVRLAQVCFFSNKRLSSKYFSSDEIVYMSPLLWFNLNKHPSQLVQPDIRLQIEVNIIMLLLLSCVNNFCEMYWTVYFSRKLM